MTDTLFVTQKEDKYLFLNTALPNWLVLNQNGAFIINLIDKKRSIKDIYGYLEKLKANISMDELLELFISLKKYGIIDDFDLKNQKKLIKKNQNNSSKLHIVHLKLTDECNLSCKYCYAETKQQKANHTLGAQITWQVSGSNTVYYASRASGTGASVTSKSKNLKGKKGKSFGYYYVDGKLKHESTAWMNFKF